MKISISKKNETILAISFLTAIVLIAFWKLALMKGLLITDDIFASDIMNEGFPYRFSLSDALKSHHLPLWVREIYGGFPLLARAEAGICYPINIILFGLLSPYWALNIVILLTIVTAGVGMYLYTREIGSSFIGSIMSGVAFSFSGYLLSHLKHLSNVNAACWLPLGLFFLERAIKKNDYRNLLWVGVVFCFQHLSGHTQVAYYSGLVYLFYFVFRYLNHQKEISKQKIKLHLGSSLRKLITNKFSWYFVGMLLLGSLLGAIQLVPTYELVSLSQRSGGVSFQYASNYAYDPKNFWMFFYPYVNGDIGNYTYTGKSIFWEDYGYVGIVILLLAVFAALRQWKQWYVKYFSIAAVVSYILVLGPNTPVYEFVFNYFPGMKYFRFPTRFLLITDFSLIVLASLGLTQLITRLGKSLSQSRKNDLSISHPVELIVLTLVMIDLFYFQLRQNPIVDADKWMNPPKSVGYIKSDTSLYRFFSVGGNQAHTLMFQQARGWEGDLQPFIDQREFIQPSSNVLYGISTPNGYANLTPNYIVDIWGDQNRAGIIMQTATIRGDTFLPTSIFWKLMNMHNVKYLSSLWQIAPSQNLKSLDKFGNAYFYRNDDYFPRAFLVGRSLRVSDNKEAIRNLFSPAFDPKQTVMLYESLPNFLPYDSIQGRVDMIGYTTNQAEFNVECRQNVILVFSDSYYPGWIAEVDGRETKIYQANITQRAVVVPQGKHVVKFEFKPRTVMIGFWVSMAAIVIFISLFAVTLFRKNNERICV